MVCRGDGPRVFARGDKVSGFTRGDKVRVFAQGHGGRVITDLSLPRHPGLDPGSMVCKGDGPRVFARGDKGKIFTRGDRGRLFARGEKGRVFARGNKLKEFASHDLKPRAIPEFGNPKDPVQHSKIVQNHWTPQDTSTPIGVTLVHQRFIP